VRLLGLQGAVVWERADVGRRPLAYPASAPRLTPGARYTWELVTREHGVQKASFEVTSSADATRVTEALGVLTPDGVDGYPPATLALMRAGLLFQESLYADARRELTAGIAAAPEEATLHLLLGHVYDRTGLKRLAAEEFDEAEALAAPRP
jgi:Flp pilus assembly protein TadD